MKPLTKLSDSLLLAYVRFEVWLFLAAPSFAWKQTPPNSSKTYAAIIAPYSSIFAIATAVVAMVVFYTQAPKTPR